MESCQPEPMINCFLHLIENTLIEQIPDEKNPHRRPIKNPAEFPKAVGILSSKKFATVKYPEQI